MSERPAVRGPQALVILGVVGILAVVVVLASRGGMAAYVPGHLRVTVLPGGQPGPLPTACSSAVSICRQAGSSRSVSWLALWLGLALGVLLIVSSAILFAVTRPSRSPQEEEPEVSDTLPPEPRSRRPPSNPREAVLAAFGDLEDRLSAAGVGRFPTEGADSYLTRALPARWRTSSARATLVRWYAVARYSEHSISSLSAAQAVDAATELARGTFGDHGDSAAPPEAR
ncbi:MAG: DUF4129 domain-containing protein [Candidatus Dormibacteraeota bacterium]|nr:DUF4129 domain-containing protein [Candidatus Dormibacteraeota bacterium]